MRDLEFRPRPDPDWLITEGYEDEVWGLVSTGKEADVFLIERRSDDRSCLLAHKRYRPREPSKGELRERGFSRATSFRRDDVYRAGRTFRFSRDQRAADRKSRYGRRVLAHDWVNREFEVLDKAWRAGARVPYPVELTGEGVLMQYIGDEDNTAPRLIHAGLGPDQMRSAFDQILDSVRALASRAIVHADLSAFNVLWWRDEIHLIDFPQAVDVASNPMALDLLHRDVTRLCSWFQRKGLACDPEAVFVDLLREVT